MTPSQMGGRAPTRVAEAGPRRWRLPLGAGARRAILLGGDMALLVALVAIALVVGGRRSDWTWADGAFVRAAVTWAAVLIPLWLVLAWADGLYDIRRAPDRATAAVLSAKASLRLLVIWALAYFIPPPWTLVRHVAIVFALGAAAALPVWRLAYAAAIGRAAFRRRILVIGAGRAGRALVAAVRTDAPELVDVVGFVDDDARLGGMAIDGVTVLGECGRLVPLAHAAGAEELVLAVSRDVHGALLAALMDAQEQGLRVTPMPVLYEVITGRVPVEHIGDHWAVALPLDPPAARGVYRLAQRGYDIAFALAGLALLVPLVVVVAPLIRAGSPGPLFYRQERVGRGGRPFTLFKLRTMVADAEPDGPVWAAADDPRATRVGRWLRRTRLDELPQALNVLRGEMSVVGPRPERPAFVARLAAEIPFYRARNAVRPGLTGWATVHQGYARSSADALLKLQYDLYYIKHQSLALDLSILVRTAALLAGVRRPNR